MLSALQRSQAYRTAVLSAAATAREVVEDVRKQPRRTVVGANE
jgi:hypothetical protein